MIFSSWCATAERPHAIADYLASALAQTKGLGIKSINPADRLRLTTMRAPSTSTIRADLRRDLAADHAGVAAGRDRHRHRRIRCICTPTISASPAMSRPRCDDAGCRRQAVASRASAILRLWQRGQARFLFWRGAARRSRQHDAECHRRRRPSDVPPDGHRIPPT